MRPRTVLILALALVGPAACGEDSEGEAAATASGTAQAARSGERPPAELLGTYATTLDKADVPAQAGPELADQRKGVGRGSRGPRYFREKRQQAAEPPDCSSCPEAAVRQQVTATPRGR